MGGKTFFQNDSQWVDAAVQKLDHATPVRLRFGSPEYFEFIEKNPTTAAWLSLGQNLRFVWKNTVYEIYD